MRNVLTVALAGCLALLPVKAVRAQSAEVETAMSAASAAYGVTYRFMRCLAWAEASFDPGAHNGTLYHGLYQFTWRTWYDNAPRFGFENSSPYDAWAAAHVTAGVIATQSVVRTNGMWPPSRRCGSPWY